MDGVLRLVGIVIVGLGAVLIGLATMGIVAAFAPSAIDTPKALLVAVGIFGPWVLLGLHLALRHGWPSKRRDRVTILAMLACVVLGAGVLLWGVELQLTAAAGAAVVFWSALTFALPAAMVWTAHTRG